MAPRSGRHIRARAFLPSGRRPQERGPTMRLPKKQRPTSRVNGIFPAPARKRPATLPHNRRSASRLTNGPAEKVTALPGERNLWKAVDSYATPRRIHTMKRKRVKLGDQFRREIDRSGLSRNAIARALGIDKGHLSRFMAGKSGLSLGNLEIMADLLKLDIVASGKAGGRKHRPRKAK